MELRYPFVFIILLIGFGLFVFFFRKGKTNNTFTTGSKIANTKYLKENKKFQEKLQKYNYYKRLLLCLFALMMLSSALLLSRLAMVTSTQETKYNRDIFLCMDISMSVDELNLDIIDSYKDIINKLNGERFGISIFNTSSVILVPLTDDYDYVNDVLDQLKKSISTIHTNYTDTYSRDYIMSGTLEGNTKYGSSLIGDGLASCVYSFPKKQLDRTRLIIFSTDNDLAGTPVLSLSEAADVSKKYNVKVFGIGTKGIKSSDRSSMEKAVNSTGGKYYDHSDSSINNIVSDIEKTSKSLLKGDTQTKKNDIPTIPFIILIFSICGFMYISKKVIG